MPQDPAAVTNVPLAAATGELSGHVIVCGLHGVGVRVVELLHLAGETVVVIDEEPDPRLVQRVRDWAVPMVGGSPRHAGTLRAAGIERALAVVCAMEEDLHNLETALVTHELRPDVRLAVHVANPGVGRALAGVTGAGTVLDAAALAAPSFVEACLEQREHRLSMGGEEFVVVERIAGHGGRLRDVFGDLAPLAVVGDDGEVTVCPGRDLQVGAGMRVVVFGTAADLAGAAGDAVERPSLQRQRQGEHHLLRRAWGVLNGFATATERALRVTLLVLLGVFVISAVVLRAFYRKDDGSHMSTLDAAYFSVETIGTVGFGDFNFAGQAPWLRIWAIVLMLLGVTLVTVTVALLTNLLVSRRIAESLGRQQVTGMVDHVLLIGLGTVGLRVLQGLRAAGRDVVVVERDENNRYLGEARAMGVPIVIADATLSQTLQAVNLHGAAAVAVLTSNELTNIETGLAVLDQLGERRDEVPVVLRVFDRALAHTIERGFGLRQVRSTSALAAPWFVGIALGLDVLATFYLATFYVETQPFLVGSLTVKKGGGLDGLDMQDLSERTRVVAISRASLGGVLEHPPRRDTRFAAGDQAYLVGPYEELLQVLARDSAG